MDARQRHLIQASVAASRPENKEALRQAIADVRDTAVVDRSELYESFLQLYLFAGFPAALEALRALEKLWPSPVTQSVAEVRSHVVKYPEFLERGEILYKRVYAKNADVVEREMLRLSPDVAAWAVVEGYGKTLSREGLDMPSRELCIVGVLTQLGWDRQLFSHILGARNVGASDDDIREAIRIGASGDERKQSRGDALLARTH